MPSSTRRPARPKGSDSEFRKIFAQSLSSSPSTSPSFCGHGPLPDSLRDPHLLVGERDIGLPLTESAFRHIADVATVSPCGVGVDKTVVDTSIRSSLELQPAQFTIRSRYWESKVTEFVRTTIAPQLDIDASDAQFIQLHLYKLLIYPTSTFFKAHRDTEKIDGHFATLVVQLPSIYTGGKLTFAHNEELVTADLSGPQAEDGCLYSVHYTDVTHQVSAITSGTRVALVYNLEWKGKPEKAPTTNFKPDALDQAVNYLRTHSQQGFPAELRFALSHCYTPAALKRQGVRCLKGLDAKVYSFLKSAALQLERSDHSGILFFLLERQIHTVDAEDPEADDLYSHQEDSETNPDPKSVFEGDCDQSDNEKWDIFDEDGKQVKSYIEPNNLFGHGTVTRTMTDADPVYPKRSSVYHVGYGNEGPSIERTYRGFVLLAVPVCHLHLIIPRTLPRLLPAIPDLMSNPKTAGAVNSLFDELAKDIKAPDASSAKLIDALGSNIAKFNLLLSKPGDFSAFLSRVEVLTGGLAQAIEARGGAETHHGDIQRLVKKLPEARRAEVLGTIKKPSVSLQIFLDIAGSIGSISFAQLADAIVKLAVILEGTEHRKTPAELWGIIESHHTLGKVSDLDNLSEDILKVMKAEQTQIPLGIVRQVLELLLQRTPRIGWPSKDLLINIFSIFHRSGYPELCADEELLEKYMGAFRCRSGKGTCDNSLIEAFHIIRLQITKAMTAAGRIESTSCTGRMNAFARGPLAAFLLAECNAELAPGPPSEKWVVPAPYCGPTQPDGFVAFCASSNVTFTTPARSFSSIHDARSWISKLGTTYFECKASGTGSNAAVTVRKLPKHYEERKARYNEVVSFRSVLTSWAQPIRADEPLRTQPLGADLVRDAKRPREEEIIITDDEN